MAKSKPDICFMAICELGDNLYCNQVVAVKAERTWPLASLLICQVLGVIVGKHRLGMMET